MERTAKYRGTGSEVRHLKLWIVRHLDPATDFADHAHARNRTQLRQALGEVERLLDRVGTHDPHLRDDLNAIRRKLRLPPLRMSHHARPAIELERADRTDAPANGERQAFGPRHQAPLAETAAGPAIQADPPMQETALERLTAEEKIRQLKKEVERRMGKFPGRYTGDPQHLELNRLLIRLTTLAGQRLAAEQIEIQLIDIGCRLGLEKMPDDD